MKKTLVEYLKDFFVLKEGGKCIFSKNSDLIKDESLFTGFLEAINGFYTLAFNDELDQIEGKNLRITFLNKEECQFVGISPMTVKNEEARDELEYFADIFISRFGDELENGENVRIFHSFSSEIIKTKSQYLTELLEKYYLVKN